MYDVIIVGSGPAGLTAAIYTGRAGLKTLVLEALTLGGNTALTDQIDNYPGFPFGISGSNLIENFLKQAERFGVEVKMEEVTKIEDLGDRRKKVVTDQAEYLARAIIISTGAKRKELNVEGEEKLQGRGVSYCATCDGAFFKGLPVAVVGGGDSAVKEALFLSGLAEKVYLIHRSEQFRANRLAVQKMISDERIELKLNKIVERIEGEHEVEKVVIRDTINDTEEELNVAAVFISIGLEATAEFLRDMLDHEQGYILTDENMETSVKGIFAAGDIRTKRARQIATAVGDGALSGISVIEYLKE